MRRGVQFTQRRIERWTENGRGIGMFEHYRPLHQVTRDDPGSRGRSRIYMWHRIGRQCHFLSDIEFVTFLCGNLFEDLVDCREQFPLTQLDAEHEITHYGDAKSFGRYRGTLTVAGQLEFAHPLLRETNGVAYWPITTDLLFARGTRACVDQLHAVSVKRTVPIKRRTWELLAIEERYWRARDVYWQLVTIEDFKGGIFHALMSTAAYALAEWRAPDALIDMVSELALRLEGAPLISVFEMLQRTACLQPVEAACAFWQAVWARRIPFDLRLPIRAGSPLRLVDAETFRGFNPLERGARR